jgi:transposase
VSWVLQAQVDAAERPGGKTAEAQRIRELKRKVRDLKEACHRQVIAKTRGDCL